MAKVRAVTIAGWLLLFSVLFCVPAFAGELPYDAGDRDERAILTDMKARDAGGKWAEYDGIPGNYYELGNTLHAFGDEHAHDEGEINEYFPGFYVTHNPTSETGWLFASFREGDIVAVNGELVRIVYADTVEESPDMAVLRRNYGDDTVIFQTCSVDRPGYVCIAYGYSDKRPGPFCINRTSDGRWITLAKTEEYEKWYDVYEALFYKVDEQYQYCLELYKENPYSRNYARQRERYKVLKERYEVLKKRID